MLCQGDQGQPGTWLWIAASEVDALYSELEARGAHLRHPPANYPWGLLECQVTDLDGHVYRFGSDNRPGEPMGSWRDGKGHVWLIESAGSWCLAE
jgi:hypothetical protein